MVAMCEQKTRVWCYRISTLLIVFSVLLSMILQIWNYYFSLITEMDSILETEPKLAGIVEICDHKIQFEWNIQCIQENVNWRCQLPENVYIDMTPHVTIEQNTSFVWIPDDCVKMKFWILPW